MIPISRTWQKNEEQVDGRKEGDAKVADVDHVENPKWDSVEFSLEAADQCVDDDGLVDV